MGIDEMNLLYQLKSCLWAMNRHNYPAICREVFDNRNYLNKRDTTFPVFALIHGSGLRNPILKNYIIP